MPVYDEALDFLASHRKECDKQIERLRSIAEPTPEQRAEMDAWEVDGYVNDPATRSLFRETGGSGYMDRPVMRHLAERKWKKEGGQDLIMGRIYQNKVVPDVVPDIAPLNPLLLAVDNQTIEPGSTMDSRSIEKPPALHYQSFQHPSIPTNKNPNPSALYTLVVVNPDEPDTVNHSYSTRLHYLKTDIPLSVISDSEHIINSTLGKEIVSWEPIAPPKHTDRHRLVFVLFRQYKDTFSKLTSAPPRENFNVRSLMATFDFPLNSIVGINLVKTQWTEESSEHIDNVWKKYRGADKAPVFSEFAHHARSAKPLSPVQKRAEALRERAWQRSVEELEREMADPTEIEEEDVPRSGKPE